MLSLVEPNNGSLYLLNSVQMNDNRNFKWEYFDGIKCQWHQSILNSPKHNTCMVYMVYEIQIPNFIFMLYLVNLFFVQMIAGWWMLNVKCDICITI